MQITIAAIGKIASSPIKLIMNEYIKRIPWKIQIIEHQTKYKIEKTKDLEAQLLLNSCVNHYNIMLDEHGIKLSSLDFAKLLEKSQQEYSKIGFLIGGAYGHGQQVKNQAKVSISLSNMTLPHLMARMLLVEQIYRAYTIINNHPYHKV